MDEVHFHEVGAIDSIVDIVSVAILMDYIKPDRVISSVVSDGCGTIKCAHGGAKRSSAGNIDDL